MHSIVSGDNKARLDVLLLLLLLLLSMSSQVHSNADGGLRIFLGVSTSTATSPLWRMFE
jgi:hypothetical protein